MPARQFVAVKFRPGDRRTYTYHNDGEPVSAGQEVKVPDKSGNGWSRVTVDSVSWANPPFPAKPILGLAPPVTPEPASDLFPDGAAEQ